MRTDHVTIDRDAIQRAMRAAMVCGAELARRSDLSVMTVSAARNGRRVAASTARAIAKTLRVPVKSLIVLDEDVELVGVDSAEVVA